MQNWYTKAPSGGIQQHYPRCEMEQLQITKPSVLDSIENLKEAALQDQPGTEPHRNCPYLKEEKQIMAEGVVPLGAQEQEKSSKFIAGEKLTLFLALCKAAKSFLFLSRPWQRGVAWMSAKLCGAVLVYLSVHFPFFPWCLWENCVETSQVWSESSWRISLIFYETDGLYF